MDFSPDSYALLEPQDFPSFTYSFKAPHQQLADLQAFILSFDLLSVLPKANPIHSTRPIVCDLSLDIKPLNDRQFNLSIPKTNNLTREYYCIVTRVQFAYIAISSLESYHHSIIFNQFQNPQPQNSIHFNSHSANSLTLGFRFLELNYSDAQSSKHSYLLDTRNNSFTASSATNRLVVGTLSLLMKKCAKSSLLYYPPWNECVESCPGKDHFEDHDHGLCAKCNYECELGCNGPHRSNCFQHSYKPKMEAVEEDKFQQGEIDIKQLIGNDSIECDSRDVRMQEFFVHFEKPLVGLNSDIKVGVSIKQIKKP